jgi:hypothetical protein
MMKSKLKSGYITLNALMVWFALILQFSISTKLYITEGRTLAGAFIRILSYYTIQTNLLVAVALTILLLKPASGLGKFFSKTSVSTAIAVYITIVGLVYNFILKGTWKPEGLFKLADILLHTASPVVFVIFWLLFVPKENINWKQIFRWAIFPFLYLIYSLIRGAISGEYPYPFINAAQIGYQQVAVNAVLILIAFLIICAGFIGVNRLLKGIIAK